MAEAKRKAANPGEAKRVVQAWIQEHPDGTRTECIAALVPGIGRSTIYKAWDKLHEGADGSGDHPSTGTDQTSNPDAPTADGFTPAQLAQLAQLLQTMQQPTTSNATTATDATGTEDDAASSEGTIAQQERATQEMPIKKRPGPRRVTLPNGLRPGQERATFIVDSDKMRKVRNIAKRRYSSVKQIMDDALTAYLATVDPSEYDDI